jgi:hypothetical protein
MGELERAGDERTEKETERFFEYLEEEKNKMTKANAEEATGKSSQAAASSSGGGGEEVQRGRGGVSLEPTNKRMASEDQREQPEKKSKNEQEERGLKRRAVEWEMVTKE